MNATVTHVAWNTNPASSTSSPGTGPIVARAKNSLSDPIGVGWIKSLPILGRYLNEKDPTVVVPQPPTNGLEKGDVETWGNVVLVKGCVPAVVDANALP